MNIEQVLANAIERIIGYQKEYREKGKDNFNDGVCMGIYIALSCLKSDLEFYDSVFLEDDKEILKKTGLDIDLDKLNL